MASIAHNGQIIIIYLCETVNFRTTLNTIPNNKPLWLVITLPDMLFI